MAPSILWVKVMTRADPKSNPARQHAVRAKFAWRFAGAAALFLFFTLTPALAWTQSADPQKPADPPLDQQSPQSANSADSATLPEAPTPAAQKTDSSVGQQTKRMFGVVPNFSSVSADTQLPPLTARGKFWLATQDSVDYSSFIWAGMLASQSMALNSYPELHQGLKGYSRYYWRAFADQASGAYFTEAIIPALTHEDPRYYTLGHGGFFHRAGYALTQVVVTKTDSGGRTFNFSEVVGNGMEAGLSNLYYPPEERSLHNTAVNYVSQLEAASLNNLVREFWPDIRHRFLRKKQSASE
jgi:hypothetical protein